MPAPLKAADAILVQHGMVGANNQRNINPAGHLQATLLAFSVRGIAMQCNNIVQARKRSICAAAARTIRRCLASLRELLPSRIALTDELGIDADWVEAAAFAWLARQNDEGMSGNLPSVTGASGYRVLGAIYPAS